MIYDFIVIGAGIIGMSTAWQLQQTFPGCTVLGLGKTALPACHQAGRNSVVIHRGIYYTPGSLNASFCKEWNSAPQKLCAA